MFRLGDGALGAGSVIRPALLFKNIGTSLTATCYCHNINPLTTTICCHDWFLCHCHQTFFTCNKLVLLLSTLHPPLHIHHYSCLHMLFLDMLHMQGPSLEGLTVSITSCFCVLILYIAGELRTWDKPVNSDACHNKFKESLWLRHLEGIIISSLILGILHMRFCCLCMLAIDVIKNQNRLSVKWFYVLLIQ